MILLKHSDCLVVVEYTVCIVVERMALLTQCKQERVRRVAGALFASHEPTEWWRPQ